MYLWRYVCTDLLLIFQIKLFSFIGLWLFCYLYRFSWYYIIICKYPILCIMFSLFCVVLWSRKACCSNVELIYLFFVTWALVSYLRTSHLIKVMKIYSISLWVLFRNIIHLSSFLCALWRRDPILFFFRLISSFVASFVLMPLSKITDHKSEGLLLHFFTYMFIPILVVSFLITYFWLL